MITHPASYPLEAEHLYFSLFGMKCPDSIRDLYASASAELERTWAFNDSDYVWLRKVLKFKYCLAELAWLAKGHKSNPRDILWVKMHLILYLSELMGMDWAHRGKPQMRTWLALAGELLLKPFRLLSASYRLMTHV